MTAHKHFKQLIRARMEKTGERYSAARRFVIVKSDQPHTDPATRWHFAGNIPATTALRTLLANAGTAPLQSRRARARFARQALR